MISRLKNAIQRQAQYRRTTDELSRLTDRELGDLGISRNQIRSVARAAITQIG